eukprot:9494910-Pyramimonas_sp.AAC.1
MVRYCALGSLAEVIRDKAAKAGHVITEDWLKSFSISVGKLDEEAIPRADAHSRELAKYLLLPMFRGARVP